MAVYINSVQITADAAVEPVSRTDVKNWLRIDYTSDDTLIDSLISGARQHLEKLTGRSLVNKLITANIELSGQNPKVWIVDLPYSPLVCVNSVTVKEGVNDTEALTVNDDYEVIGGKLWLYIQGIYTVVYQAGYGVLPNDLRNDMLTLVSWMYENRGKQMNADPKKSVTHYPSWEGLNYHQYRQVVI